MLLCTLMFVLLYSINVFAATSEATIEISADRYSNAVFYITWENVEKMATVEIVSPDGTIYSAAKTPDNVYEANGEAMVRVGKAAAGSWIIKVTGDDIGKVEASVGQLPSSMIIDSFSVTETNGKFTAQYKVSDCPEEVYVEIFVDNDDEGFDGKSVYSGRGGAVGTAELNLNHMDSGEYHFYIVISKDGAFKRKYSDNVISYQSPNANRVVPNVIGGKYNDGYYIRWGNTDEEKQNSSQKYKVLVWDEKLNLIKQETIEGEGFYYDDFDADETKVYLAVVYENGNNKYKRVEALKDTKVDASVEFDVKESITEQRFITADVKLNAAGSFEAYLNGSKELDKQVESGRFKINMSDGDNELVFLVTDSKGNAKEFVKEIYVDSVAPALSVSQDINNVTSVKDYIYISGYSEAGATLLLNDKEVKMKKGYFNEKIELKLGENDVKLVARDVAGNESVYSAVVRYELNKSSRRELYVITGLVIVLLVVYIIVFTKGIKRKKRNNV